MARRVRFLDLEADMLTHERGGTTVVRRARRGAVEGSRELVAWVHAALQSDDTPAEPFRQGVVRERPRPQQRKAVTMGDLFDAPGLPPCLLDE